MTKITDQQIAEFVKSLSKDELDSLTKMGNEIIKANTKDLAEYQKTVQSSLNKFIEMKKGK